MFLLIYRAGLLEVEQLESRSQRALTCFLHVFHESFQKIQAEAVQDRNRTRVDHNLR